MSDEWDYDRATSHDPAEGSDRNRYDELELGDDIDLDDASTALAPTELVEPIDDEPDFDEFAPQELAGDAPAELADGEAEDADAAL